MERNTENMVKKSDIYKWIIIGIFGVGLLLRIFMVLNYGVALRVFADDRHYISGAIQFLKNGHVVGNLLYEPTLISMPGQFLWLALFVKIFGYTQSGLTMVHMCFAVIDSFTLIGVYKLSKKALNQTVAFIAAGIYAVYIPIICQTGLFMTENITVFGIVWFLYFAVRFCNSKSEKDFLIMFLFYFIALLQRTTVALLPVILIFYFIRKGFPIKKMVAWGAYAAVLLVILLAPWWYRNYLAVGEFIPTTVGGDAFLGGTYYSETVEFENNMSLAETRDAFNDPTEENSLYNRMQHQSEYAMERIKEWWAKDKSDLLYTYLIKKPYFSWYSTLRYGEIFDISISLLDRIHRCMLALSGIGFVIGLCNKNCRIGAVTVGFVMLYFAIFTSIFLPFVGYNYPAYFAMLILASVAISTFINYLMVIYYRIKQRIRR